MSPTNIDHYLTGQRDAECFLVALRASLTGGDELGDYFVRNLAGQPTAWVKGFLRVLQKRLGKLPSSTSASDWTGAR